MSDPLAVFRNSVRTKSPISLLKDGAETTKLAEATHLKFSPSQILPKIITTRIRKTGAPATSSDPNAKPEDFVTLGAVYLAWSLKDASASEYLKHVRECGYTSTGIIITERKAAVDWLEGKVKDLNNAAPLPQGFLPSK
jgi:parafibromin